MPIPMFDLKASSALAGLAHEEKIFFLCSLDRHHTAPGQQREPDPHLHNAENQSFTRLCLEQQLAQALASGMVFGEYVCLFLSRAVGKPWSKCLSNIRIQKTYSLWRCLSSWSSIQSSETCLWCANPPTACSDRSRNQWEKSVETDVFVIYFSAWRQSRRTWVIKSYKRWHMTKVISQNLLVCKSLSP